jgi:homoserine dehydrogenase
MATAGKQGGASLARVHPVFVPANVMMAGVDGVLNAVEIETDLAVRVLFHGSGAGPMPTTSALIADVLKMARSMVGNGKPPTFPRLDESTVLRPMPDLETKYYLRLAVADRPGVLAQIAKVLGDLEISIDSVIQKGTDIATQQAELVLTTHRAKEADMRQALRVLEGLEVVHDIGNMVRIEEWGQQGARARPNAQ